MPRALILASFRVLSLVALAVSSALLYDYQGKAPAFCVAGDGCSKIRESQFAHLLGIPTPVIGVIAFAFLFGLTLLPHEKRRRWIAPISIVGALSAIGFLLIQAFVEHTFCKLCVVVDSASILTTIPALVYRYRGEQGHDGSVPAVAWGVVGLVAIVAPLLFGRLQPDPEVKPAIARLWAPGKINIIEMSDFECPYCRLQHPALNQAMKPFGEQIHFVRLTVPLPGHQHARPASRLYLCAKDQGKGEEAADKLFATDLASKTIEQLGQEMEAQGVDLGALKRCVADPRTDQRVTDEFNRARTEIEFRGLPTVWVGSQLLEGARSAQEFTKAIEHAARGGRAKVTASPVWLWTSLMALIVGVAVVAVRRRPG